MLWEEIWSAEWLATDRQNEQEKQDRNKFLARILAGTVVSKTGNVLEVPAWYSFHYTSVPSF